MIKINLAATLGALNDVSKLMLEESAAYAISCGESEVLPAHLLLKSLENPFSDVRFILNKLNISHEELTALLLSKTQTSHTNIDSVPSFSPLLIEMLQEAWLLGSLEFEQTQIRSASIFLALVLNASRYLPTAVASYLNQINKETLRQSLLVFAKGSAESQTTQENTATPSAVHTDQSDLARFAENLTAKASAGNIDPVLARDKEIDLMIDILSRRRKNNPIVVGDAGVGKSALIEGLALRIVNKQVPPHLQNVELWSLDLAALQSGASIKGEFEKRLKSVIDFVKNSTTPIVLFIDEIHRISRSIEEILYSAMEDFYLDIVIGKGEESRSIRIELPPFTLVGATTRAGALTAPLRDRFGVHCRLEFYTISELQNIIERTSDIFECDIDEESSYEIAMRSRGTPRIANRLLKRVRDFAQVKNDGVIAKDLAIESLDLLQVDAKGLDNIDYKILECLIKRYDGRAVGLETIAVTIGEESITIEDVYEPYLVKEGFIERTPRGRRATPKAYQHLGINYKGQ